MNIEKINQVIREALPLDSDSYTTGFRDALESMVLAMAPEIGDKIITDVVQTALDAYENNYL